MLLFRDDTRAWRDGPTLYFDLDTVICGSLERIMSLRFHKRDKHQIAICENFTRRAGNLNWPCRYGSCVMLFGEHMDNRLWTMFEADHKVMMEQCNVYGDQRAIEILEPRAHLLQGLLPPDYMISYRDITPHRRPAVSIINFGGSHKPDNCEVDWVREQWQ
jgi:hypothetical protein